MSSRHSPSNLRVEKFGHRFDLIWFEIVPSKISFYALTQTWNPGRKLLLKSEGRGRTMSGTHTQFRCRRTATIDPCPSRMSPTNLKIGSERGGGAPKLDRGLWFVLWMCGLLCDLNWMDLGHLADVRLALLSGRWQLHNGIYRFRIRFWIMSIDPFHSKLW